MLLVKFEGLQTSRSGSEEDYFQRLLAHLGREAQGELKVLWRPSPTNFQRSSPLKPLSQLKQHFMGSLHGKGKKFI